jgi:hypothetical protein
VPEPNQQSCRNRPSSTLDGSACSCLADCERRTSANRDAAFANRAAVCVSLAVTHVPSNERFEDWMTFAPQKLTQ